MGKHLDSKKKKFIAASVATAAVATIVAPVMAEGKSFNDISPKFFAYEEVMGLANAGVISGYADGTFKPYQSITRGQTAIMLAKALDLPAAPKAKSFKDVSKNSQYYHAVSAVMQAGIIKGYGDEFKPNATLTREEMATIMVRAFKLSAKSEVKVPFTDLKSVSPTHRKNVEILYQNGLTKGKDGKTYAPQEPVTRVQISMFLYRQLEGSLPEAPETEEPTTPPADGGVVSPPPSGGGVTPPPAVTPTETIGTNIFEDVQQYEKNYVIEPAGDTIFGSPTVGNDATIKGDVTVKGSIGLQNLTIEGTLFLDPGDQGEVTLTNVKASKIEVLSGETGTIHFNGVQSDDVIVKDQNGIKIETDGNSTIGSLELAPGGKSEVQLAGNFNETNIVVTKEATLTAKDGFIASSLEINVANPDAEVKLKADAPVELPAITLSNAVKLTSQSENIRATKINVNVQDSNQTVTLNGNLGSPEVVVEAPVTLAVDSTVSKVTAKANVSLEGSEAVNIPDLETVAAEGEKVTVKSADQTIQEALDEKKTTSITEAKKNIKELDSNSALELIQEADKLVKTAISLGAVKEDFKDGEVNLLDKLEELKADVQEKIAAVKVLNEKLLALPKVENLNSYTALSLPKLEKLVKEAQDAIQAAETAGVEHAAITQLANYNRLPAVVSRIAELKNEYNTAKQTAITALQALPAADSVNVQTYLAAKTAVTNANTAIANARLKGVKDSEFTVNSVNLLTKLTEVSNAIKAVEAAKKEAITNAISKVTLIPVKDQITIQNLEEVRQKAASARAAVEAAIAKGATEANITNISLLTDAEAKITELDKARTNAIEAANTAISLLPEPADINKDSIADAKSKLEAAETAVSLAIEKGAKESDFTALDKITAVKIKIESLETSKQNAITNAVNMLALIPIADEITVSNFKAVKDNVTLAKNKIAIANELGATDTELKGIEKLQPAEAKIASLEAAFSAAITVANTKLAEIPAVAEITMENQADVKVKVEAAIAAVEAAKKSGASDADFIGLDKITEAEAKLTQLKTDKETAITAANTAISAVPTVETVTIQNYKSAEEKIATAAAAISAAREKGAVDADFTGTDRIDAAKTKIAELLKALSDAISAANTAIQALPDPSTITTITLEDAIKKLEAAKLAVKTATEKGAIDANFTNLDKINLVESKIKEFGDQKAEAIKVANEALSKIPTVSEISEANAADIRLQVQRAQLLVAEAKAKGAVDSDFTNLDKLAAAVEKLKEFESEFDLPVWDNPLEALTRINQNIEAFTQADFESATEYIYVESQFEEYKKAIQELKTQKGKDLTLADIEGVVLSLNMSLENEGLVSINNKPDELTYEDLEKIQPWIVYTDFEVDMVVIRGKLADLKLEIGTVTYYDVENVIKEAWRDSAVYAMNTEKENMTLEAMYYIVEPYNVDAYDFLYTAYQEKIKQHLAANGDLTDETLVQIIKQTNLAAENSAMEKVESNPAALTYGDLEILHIYQTDFHLVNQYRDALVEKMQEIGGKLTLDHVAAVIEAVNKEAYVAEINDGGELYRNLFYLDTAEFDFTLLAEYSEAIKAALSSGSLTYDTLMQLILSVNENKLDQIVKVINENPQAVNISDLNVIKKIKYSYLDSAALQDYRNALEEAINASEVALSAEDIIDVIMEVNNTLTLEALNTNPDIVAYNRVTHLLEGSFYYVLWSQYLQAIKAEHQAEREITQESLNKIVADVNAQAADEYLARIIENPEELKRETLYIAFPQFWVDDDLIEEYRQLILDLKQESGTPTREAIEQAIEDLNQAYLEENRRLIVKLLNETPEAITLERLYDLQISFDSKLFEAYKSEFIEQHENGTVFTFTLVEEIILQITKVAALEKVTTNPEKLTLQELASIYGWSLVRYENLSSYQSEIKLVIEAGGNFTVDSLKELIITVNQKVADSALKLINSDPMSVTVKTLRAVGNFYVEADWLEHYREAIKTAIENGELNAQQLATIINTVNTEQRALKQQQALTFILSNPDTFTASDLESAGFWEAANEYGQYINRFRTAIKAKVQTDGTDLTYQEVLNLIYAIINEIRKTQSEEALKLINTDLENVTFESFELVFPHNVREAYFVRYIAELEKLVAEGPVTLTQVQDLIILVNKQEALADINSGKSVTFEHLVDAVHGTSIFSQYLNDYHTAIEKELHSNQLTFEKLIEIVTEINQQKGLENIIANPQGFTFEDLGKITGWQLINHFEFTKYRQAIISYVESQQELTAEKLIELINGVNQENWLLEIQLNPGNVQSYKLKYLLDDPNGDLVSDDYQVLQKYRQKLTELVATKTTNELLKLDEVKNVIIQVNQQVQEEKAAVLKAAVEAFNQKITTFEIGDLEAVLGYNAGIIWDNLDFYRKAIEELYKGVALTVEQIAEAVVKGNATAENVLLDKVNNNTKALTDADFRNLVVDSNGTVLLYSELDEYRDAIAAAKTKSATVLSREDVVAVIKKVNEIALQDMIEAINTNPLQMSQADFDALALLNVSNKYDYYRLYQLAFINLQNADGNVLTKEQIIQVVDDINREYGQLFAFVLPNEEGNFKVGEYIDVEFPAYSGVQSLYIIPKQEENPTTKEELQQLILAGVGKVVEVQNYNRESVDTAALQPGEYVVFAVGFNGDVSQPSNAFKLEGEATTAPVNGENPEPPAGSGTSTGATMATMQLNKLSTTEFEVTVTDLDQNLDSAALDSVEVIVANQSDEIITVSLEEVGENTGTFKGTFTFSNITNDENNSIVESYYVQVGYKDNEESGSVVKEIENNKPVN